MGRARRQDPAVDEIADDVEDKRNRPDAGANSFTQTQAKDRMEKAGFTQASNIEKDDSGIWRARAMQGDKPVSIALDFRGNVVASQ